MWYPTRPGIADELVSTEPNRFFHPQPSASGVFSTWLGMDLDTTGQDGIDRDEVAAVLEETYRLIAPKRFVAQLDNP